MLDLDMISEELYEALKEKIENICEDAFYERSYYERTQFKNEGFDEWFKKQFKK